MVGLGHMEQVFIVPEAESDSILINTFATDIWGLSAFVKASKQSVPSKVRTLEGLTACMSEHSHPISSNLKY